jgi:acetylornithine/succinyldiaminopimelate/putrescine aminotransferase
MTDAGGRHEGKIIKMMSMVGAFHGRTDRPAQISHNSLKTYQNNMATFRDRDNLITVQPGDIEGIKAAFEQADKDNVFIEAVFIEPVMGEGVPGRALQRDFYDTARKLTRDHGSMLIIDSIQAGFRGTGCLSLTDYPGFEDSDAPDMETYSKALNAGQYPLSVLAMGPDASKHLVRGVYGNTMTTNPRALEVGAAVLEQMTDDVRTNIEERGVEFVEKLKVLAKEFPGAITHVEGTGLLLCAELDPEKLPVVGFDGIETYCRKHGVGVIHGGQNALRFTPHFRITSGEIDIVINVIRDGLNLLWK